MAGLVRGLLLGQLLAFLIACTAVCSVLLVDQGVSVPTFQSFANYLALALVWGCVSLRSRRRRAGTHHDGNLSPASPRHPHPAWWAWALLGLLDVEANACLVAAYRWTSLTSVQLLDAWTIPAVLLLSSLFLGARYGRDHGAGAALCVLGFCLLVLYDGRGGGSSSSGGGVSGAAASLHAAVSGRAGGMAGRAGIRAGGPTGAASHALPHPCPLLGDGLTLVGATLYAASNVVQERLLGRLQPRQLLAGLGTAGAGVSLLQVLVLEMDAVRAVPWTRAVVLPALGYAAAMFAFYSLVPAALRWNGAALLNLSLLAADVWTGAARAALFEGFTAPAAAVFLLCFAVIAAGIAIFVSGGEVVPADSKAATLHEQRQELSSTPQSPAALQAADWGWLASPTQRRTAEDAENATAGNRERIEEERRLLD